MLNQGACFATLVLLIGALLFYFGFVKAPVRDGSEVFTAFFCLAVIACAIVMLFASGLFQEVGG